MIKLTLSNEDDSLLRWMSARGYDAGLVGLASTCEYSKPGLLKNDGTDDGVWVRTYQEHDTWEIADCSTEEGFLSCCGSDTLATEVHRFLGAIV